jgi:hypothetical protein
MGSFPTTLSSPKCLRVKKARQRYTLQNDVEQIAEDFRQEQFKWLYSNCLTKSIRFVRRCNKERIPAKLVLGLDLKQFTMPLVKQRFYVPALHFWGEAAGKRIEVARPLRTEPELGIKSKKIHIMQLRIWWRR